jgi:AAA+ ATPase superfamily predicted ATPase
MTNRFIGREQELSRLQHMLETRVASLIVLKGRRRIGKSRLAEEFGRSFRTLTFSGLAPSEGTTAKAQREHFALQIVKQLQVPPPSAGDWNELFWHLAHHTREGRVLIVLDEISWMGSGDPAFAGKLKTAWDLEFKKNDDLVLILTGSVSSWIEKNILGSTGFVGRISLDLSLGELPLYRCNEFWGVHRDSISAYEKFKLLAVTGGVPRYLEELVPSISAKENICRLCFRSGGLLVREFDRIFSDLFHRRSSTYKAIVTRLAEGVATFQEIETATGIKGGGRLTEYLYDLETAGFIQKDATWSIRTAKELKIAHYRLKDNYLRFYIKYILPNLSRIEKDEFEMNPHKWPAIFGLQFENLVISNRHRLIQLLGLRHHDIEWDNPYFQRGTRKQRGCQIDYLIQTRDRCLYLCEIKFSQDPVASSVIKEVEEKMQAITLPRGFSIRPVLIHVNGVSNALSAEEYFSRVIDFRQFLRSPRDI